MPKKPAERKPSAAELAARARSLTPRKGAEEAFDMGSDYVRELVVVDSLPDPPATEVMEAAQQGRKKTAVPERVNIDEAVMNILREEAQEIQIRFERYGLAFPPQLQQDMIDHVYSLLALNGQGIMTGGGAIARR